MPRKPSPRSPLKMLPPELQERLAEYLRTNTLAMGVKYCREELQLNTNDSSLSEWLSWFEMMARINHYAQGADDLKEALAQTSIDPDLIPKLGEAFFISKAAESGDSKMFATVASVVQRHQELKAQQAAHTDKMQVAARQIEVRKDNIKLLLRRVEAAEKKAAALEARNAAALASASKAKDILNSGALSDEARAMLTATMDELILGVKKKPVAVKAAATT